MSLKPQILDHITTQEKVMYLQMAKNGYVKALEGKLIPEFIRQYRDEIIFWDRALNPPKTPTKQPCGLGAGIEP